MLTVREPKPEKCTLSDILHNSAGLCSRWYVQEDNILIATDAGSITVVDGDRGSVNAIIDKKSPDWLGMIIDLSVELGYDDYQALLEDPAWVPVKITSIECKITA